MWRETAATCLSYQYQRSRNSTASATKNIGMPLARASSITGGSSKLTWADSSTPSSLRSRRSCVISAAGGSAPAAAANISAQHATTAHKPRCKRLRNDAFFQQGVIKTVVITLEIVRDGIALCFGLGH